MEGVHTTQPILPRRSTSQDSEDNFGLPLPPAMDNTTPYDMTPPRSNARLVKDTNDHCVPDLINSPSCNQSLAGSNHSDITRESDILRRQQQQQRPGVAPSVPTLNNDTYGREKNNDLLAMVTASPSSPGVFEEKDKASMSPMRGMDLNEKQTKESDLQSKKTTSTKTSSPRKRHCRETVAVIFNDDIADGEVVTRSLSVSGCNVIVILRTFNTLVASNLLKIPNVTVLVLDSTDSKKYASMLEGVDRAILMTKYWEKFESKREERKALALITACHQVGVSQIIISTVENVRPLKKRGIPSQVTKDQRPTFAGMKKARRFAKKTKIQLLHMLTSYRDYTKSNKSMCLLSAGKGEPVVIRSRHSILQEGATALSASHKARKQKQQIDPAKAPVPLVVGSSSLKEGTETTQLVSPMSHSVDERASSKKRSLLPMIFVMTAIIGSFSLMTRSTQEQPKLEDITKASPVIVPTMEFDGKKHEIETSLPVMVTLVSYVMGSTWVVVSNGLLPGTVSTTSKVSLLLLAAYACISMWNPQQQQDDVITHEIISEETMNVSTIVAEDAVASPEETLFEMNQDLPKSFKTMSFDLMLSLHGFLCILTALSYVIMALFVRAPMKTFASAYLLIMAVTTMSGL